MNNDRIMEKIVYLDELLFELKELAKINKKEFIKSNILTSAAENYLRKALQVVIDLAEDMVSKNRLRTLHIIL